MLFTHMDSIDVLPKSVNMDSISFSKLHAILNIIIKDHISVHSFPEALYISEGKKVKQ